MFSNVAHVKRLCMSLHKGRVECSEALFEFPAARTG